MTTFSELALSAPLLRALEDAGYHTPTPIQVEAIPPVMRGADLLGIAQTGTGKTAAFALPILHRLAADPRPAMRKGCRVLVLSPTRELASQIAESFRTYGRHQGVRVAVIFGGVGHRPQIDAMARGVDVLVATPGRLLDHMDGRAVSLAGTEVLVLDEADQMLDLGFIKPIRQIVSQLPRDKRQTLLFSATMPREIAGLASDMLRDPIRVSVAPVATTVERVSQRVVHIEQKRKRALLAELLGDPELTRALVFTRTKRGADRVAEHLEGAGFAVAAIHGNKSQNQRERALESFKASKIRILVATDIAARGIDIDDVSHVFNYELPEVPEAYVHRIGRTARAGAAGIAVSLCDPEERDLLKAIERLTRLVIPAEDRRNDQGLEIEAGARSGGNRRDGRRQGGREGGRDVGNGSGRAPGGRAPGGRAQGDRTQERSQSRSAGRGERSKSEDHRPAFLDRGDRGRNGGGSRERPSEAPRTPSEGRRSDRPAGGQRPEAGPAGPRRDERRAPPRRDLPTKHSEERREGRGPGQGQRDDRRSRPEPRQRSSDRGRDRGTVRT